MKKHDGNVRGFNHFGASWYASSIPKSGDGVVDSISIGLYTPGSSATSGEFMVEWVMVGGKLSPRLAVFDDGWSALQHFRDLLAQMAELDNQDVTPHRFCEVLASLGIDDRTERVQPHPKPLACP